MILSKKVGTVTNYGIISTPRPAVQQLTNSSPLTPAISSRWGFREKVLDSSPIESYHGHTNKATEILWKN